MISKWRTLGTIISWCIISLSHAAHAAPITITNIKLSDKSSCIQIALKLSAPTQPHIFTLANPDRLIFDFTNTKLAVKLTSLHFPHSLITNVRSGHPVPGVLRLVFDINRSFHFQTMTKLPAQQVVVTLVASGKHAEKLKLTEKKQAAAASTKSILINRPVMTVIIDPGHGGKDTGAIGKSKTLEKDVVLKISKQLADLINRTSTMRAVLTRNGDYYVSLHNRLVYARKNKADIYISIHADSYFNHWASGASVYALSKNGATSIAARWLAKRNNYSELGGVSLSELNDQSPLLRSVLIDLAQTVTVTDSMRLGTALLDEMDNITPLHYSRVEQAPFMVLKSPDIPSVLVEVGFISNPTEELRLRNKDYEHKIALSLFNGIRNYQKKYYTVTGP